MRRKALARAALLTGVALLRAVLFSPLPGWAATPDDSLKKEESVIPKRPSTPPPLATRGPQTTFQCERHYLYKGKLLDCDSYLYQDGEKLRPIFHDTPAAVQELNSYQDGRREVHALAYTGTLGLVLVLVGIFGGRRIDGMPGVAFRNTFMGAGILITAGSTLYGFKQLSSNEQHLGNAVNFYNQDHPDNPVQLQFSTGVSF